MNTPSHLEETLQRDIDLLQSKVKEMAERSAAALQASLNALIKANLRQAYLVILRDQYIDELENELDRLCLEFLVRHQPAGAHLRFAYTTIQINKELERIGDYAESIARQALALGPSAQQARSEQIAELGRIAIRMVSDATRAFLERDAALAWKTIELEEQANRLRNEINSKLAEAAASGQLPAKALPPLMTIVRRFERAADQAKNFCEDVLYLCTGELIKHKHPHGIRILFADRTNACLSQMAEAIGRSLNLPRFYFSSAGSAPQPLDRSTVEFMEGKGIDLSAHTSKSFDAVPEWDSSNVIIVLNELQEQLRPRSGKVVVLTWTLSDPAATASTEAKQKAFASAYEFLESNIRELADAIIDNHEQKPTQSKL